LGPTGSAKIYTWRPYTLSSSFVHASYIDTRNRPVEHICFERKQNKKRNPNAVCDGVILRYISCTLCMQVHVRCHQISPDFFWSANKSFGRAFLSIAVSLSLVSRSGGRMGRRPGPPWSGLVRYDRLRVQYGWKRVCRVVALWLPRFFWLSSGKRGREALNGFVAWLWGVVLTPSPPWAHGALTV
jgi:hypothetical protein